MLEKMVRLLQSEGADGIRIYFVNDPGLNAPPFKNSIVLVSTRANGTNSVVPSGSNHQDYYDHIAADALFGNLKAINGVVSYGTKNKDAVLYKTCASCQPDNVDNTKSIHALSRQTAEQMVQGFGKHPITTNSEWFDLGLFQTFTKDKNYDGLRIYFATKAPDSTLPGSEAFVLIKTMPGSMPNTHMDYWGSPAINLYVTADGGQDNGEQCPNNCD